VRRNKSRRRVILAFMDQCCYCSSVREPQSLDRNATHGRLNELLPTIRRERQRVVYRYDLWSSTRINQYLNKKYEVCKFIKPDASANQLIHYQEMEFLCLGRKDVIVIIGGTIDISNSSGKRSGISVTMTQFMQKYNNTNIIVVNISHTRSCKELEG